MILSRSKFVDVEVEIESEDVIDYLRSCPDVEFNSIMTSVGKKLKASGEGSILGYTNSVYDDITDEYLEKVKEKYTLEEIQKALPV